MTPLYAVSQETHFKYNDTSRLKENGWEKTYQANMNEKKSWWISHKIHFRARKAPGTEEYYIMIKGCTYQEFIQEFKSVYTQNNTSSKYTKQKFRELKKEITHLQVSGELQYPYLSHHHIENQKGYKRNK